MKTFVTEGPGLPKWSSPISHAVVAGNICYLSGQLSLDASGKYIPDTVEKEAERAFENLFAAIRAAGFDPADIVFIDIAFIDLRDTAAINTLFAKLFPEGRRPARTVYQAAALPFGAKIKVTAVAIKDVRSEEGVKPIRPKRKSRKRKRI